MYKTIILLATTTLLLTACQYQNPEPSKVQYEIPSELKHSFYNK